MNIDNIFPSFRRRPEPSGFNGLYWIPGQARYDDGELAGQQYHLGLNSPQFASSTYFLVLRIPSSGMSLAGIQRL